MNNCKPNDPVFRCLLETYVAILSNNPSDHVIRHTFSALRVFINQNSQVRRRRRCIKYLHEIQYILFFFSFMNNGVCVCVVNG
ncbi:unnamed protein product [Trichobilharzia regenti]|nr:unnamed protein product [Trichobilharzia regenti]